MRSHVWMGIGLIAGLLLGLLAAALSQRGHPGLADLVRSLRPVGSLFLNLLSMVVIPLIATALFAGIAKLGDLRTVGRLVVRTLVFFWGTALAGIILGFVVASVVLPHAAFTPEQQVALRAAAADSGEIRRAAGSIPTGAQFIVQLVPANPFKAAADGNLLPVIVFVTIFGIAAATLPVDKRASLTTIADAVTDTLIRIVHWVLLLAPIGIFALVAPIVTQFGWNLVIAMAWFIIAVIAFWHLPDFWDAAVLNPLIHAGEHFSFLLVGLLIGSTLQTLSDRAKIDVLLLGFFGHFAYGLVLISQYRFYPL